jgi:hypothetical protein
MTITRIPMRMMTFAATALMLAVAAAPATAQVQSRSTDFSWSGKINPGRWLYLRNVNGSIKVERGTSDRVEVTAVKQWRRGDPDEVRIETRKVGAGDGDVVICALWNEEAECDERGYSSNDDRRSRGRSNDTSVEFRVKLPAGVKILAATVNGSVRVDGATEEVRAGTVNGAVEATSTGGPVNASTVNGDIDVRMARLGTGDLHYSTVNGTITIEVPAELDAELDMRTVNGRLNADFPITVQGRINPRHLRATIGKGGRRLALSTVNGSVNIRKIP